MIHTETKAVQIAGKLTNELRISEIKFKTVADFTYHWEYWEGKDGSLIYMSPSCERISGHKINEFFSDAGLLLKITHPDDLKLLEAHMRKSHSSDNLHEIHEVDFRIIRVDGSIATIGHVCTPVYDDRDNFIGRRISNIDITERRLAEEALQKSEDELRQLNATKDKFFSIIAHDLKSPFNSIVGFSNILVEQVREKDYDSIEKYADIIQKSSWHAIDLLMNLMEWSRSQTGRMEFSPEYFKIVEFINEIASSFDATAGQKSIIIKKALPSNATVYADKAMISTIIRNLISNAIKFTWPGGEVVVSVKENDIGLTVSVADSGVGISKDTIQKLFRIEESYTTTGTGKEKGTGLGLILCREFVEKHGGKIWVESETGKGSVFYFLLYHNR